MPDATSPARVQSRREYRQSGRLDNFVDAAFAFAITMLVISGANMPRSVGALVDALRDVPAFAACFAQLAFFWHGHVRWRETFSLTDRSGLLLSLLLVFFALIFVFPLHLVFSGLFNNFSGGFLSSDAVAFTHPAGDLYNLKTLFACYGLSYACMGGTIWMLFRHGARSATHLPVAETVELHVSAATWAFTAWVGIFSMLVALTAPTSVWVAFAGMSYGLLSLTGVVAHRARRRAWRQQGDAVAENDHANVAGRIRRSASLHYYLGIDDLSAARGKDPDLAFEGLSPEALATTLGEALRGPALFERWRGKQEDPDAVDRALAVTDPEATVEARQADLKVDLDVCTGLPMRVLRHRLELLIGKHWTLRDVRQ